MPVRHPILHLLGASRQDISEKAHLLGGEKKKISSYTRRKERERREGERRKAKADEFVLTQGLFVFSITT